MTLTVREFDAMLAAPAAELLRACCGAARWVEAMVARRPFGSHGAVLAAAEHVWWSLAPDDWCEAFARHPRIGERQDAAAQGARPAVWSAGEQASVAEAPATVREQLAAVNLAYEARFGRIYIVCASGKSAEELLAVARARLDNEPATELHVAAEEQRRITRLRLEKLLAERP